MKNILTSLLLLSLVSFLNSCSDSSKFYKKDKNPADTDQKTSTSEPEDNGRRGSDSNVDFDNPSSSASSNNGNSDTNSNGPTSDSGNDPSVVIADPTIGTDPTNTNGENPTSNTNPGTVTNTNPGTVINTNPGTVTNTNPGTVTNTNPGTVTNTNPGTVTNTNPGTVTNTNPGIVTNTNPGTITNEEPEVEIEPVYISKSEKFNQLASPIQKVDIVWVVDNSKSMKDEHLAIADNFEDFITKFIDKKVDFKMAITTTSTNTVVSANGTTSSNRGKAISGSVAKLTSSKAKLNRTQFITDFKSLMNNVGINGSAYEKGLDASIGFIERHDTFCRPDANLVIIYVSDEEDQSPQPLHTFVNLLKLKSQNKNPKIYSIVDTKLTGTPDMTLGFERYEYVTKATSGLVLDINSDFNDSLQSIGDSIINLLDSYTLAQTPVKGSVKVSVDGIVVSSNTYKVEGRAVRFLPDYIPAPDSEISISYKYK